MNQREELSEMVQAIESKFKEYNDLLMEQSNFSTEFSHEFKRIRDWIVAEEASTSKLIKMIRAIGDGINKIVSTVGIISEEADALSALLIKAADTIRDGRKIIEQKRHLLNEITKTAAEVDTLARNAEIRSYQAGEEGKGFSVVAQEMAQIALEVESPVTMINRMAQLIIERFEKSEAGMAEINRFNEMVSGLSVTLKKIGNEGIVLVPILKKILDDTTQALNELKQVTGALEKVLAEIEAWSGDAIATWEKNSIIINQFLGVAYRIKDLINPICKEQLLNVLNRYPLNRLPLVTSTRTGQSQITALLDEVVKIQNEGSKNIKELKEKVDDWREFLKALSKQFVHSQKDHEGLGGLDIGVLNIAKEIRGLDESITDLDLILERARILSLYARIEAVRPKDEEVLLPVSHRMKELAETASKKSSELKDELEKLSQFTVLLNDHSIEINSRISRLNIDSRDALKFFNLVTERVELLSKAIRQEEANLSRLDVKKTIEIAQRTSENLEKIKALNLEDDIERIITFSQNLRQAARGWPLVIPQKGTLKIGLVGRPMILDPGHRTDANSHRINIMIFKGLFQIDHLNNIIPAIATTCELSSDGKRWTFRLQPDVQYHNGQKVRAQDLVFTMKHIFKGPNRAFVEMISGCDDFVKGRRNIITGIEVIDEHTITITLDYPYLPFLATLACGVCDIIPEDFNPVHPIGAGPFQFRDWIGHIIRLEAFEHYFEGKPLIDGIEVHLLPSIKVGIELYQRDELDIVPLRAEFTSMIPADEVYTFPLHSVRYLGINLRAKSPFKDLRLRQAINMAIDRERFVNECLGGWGIPAFGIFPPGLSSYDPEIKKLNVYDPDQAREIAAEFGLGETFPLDVYDNESAIRTGEWICNELRKIGLKVEVAPRANLLEWTYLGKSILATKGWITDNGDPDNFLFPLFHSSSWGKTGNSSFYSNSEVDQLIEKARTIRNRLERDELYRKIERRIIEDLPVIPLAHSFSGYAVKKRVRGFIPDPFDVVNPTSIWLE
ncbi:MAG TPA: hypothetical protein EYP24_03210 [bacterium (Candidatus Stahlbacteria)]|nr:hypothetical protein [Candidatus Stahlbacteria bacterium]